MLTLAERPLVEHALDRHARRRAAGIPTVSVLLAPTTTVGIDAFARWAAGAGHRLVQGTDGARSDDLPLAWIEAFGGPAGVRAAAIAWLAEASGDSADTLARRLDTGTPAARQMLLEGLATARHAPSARLSLAMLVRRASNRDALPHPADLFPEEPDQALAMLDALHGLNPTRAPAVLLVSDHPDGSTLQENIRLLGGLAERLPTCATAWTLTDRAWESAAAEVADSRFKAICREGLIRPPHSIDDAGRDADVVALLD